MWSFFADLLRNADATHTIVVMDSEEVGAARRYRLRPVRILATWGGTLVATGLVVAALFVFTPLRTVIPGYGTEQIEQSARLNAMRVRALEDSLLAQRQYIDRLRQLITGRVDSIARPGRTVPVGSVADAQSSERRPSRGAATPSDGGGSERSAYSPYGVPAVEARAAEDDVTGPVFPADPPVANGFPTRGFNASTGHYGLDVAVAEGESVRALGGGYVVLAGWTQDGGHTIAVQHANGYLSIYKHNKRLLKSLGDRVRARELLAVSGNSGEITTGPHLHVEVWRNGLAQDPRAYIAGW